MGVLPTLDELVLNPGVAAGLPPCALAALQTQAAAALVAIGSALALSKQPGQNGGGQQLEEHLLSVDEAAAKLSVPREWVYRRAKKLGFAVKLGDGTLRFSSLAIERYIKAQTVSVASIRQRRAV